MCDTVRMQVVLKPRYRCAVIPRDYRRGVVSFFKGIVPQYYQDNLSRPFCFSLELPDPIYTRKYVEYSGKTFFLYISSYPPSLLCDIAKAFVNVDKLRLFGIDLQVAGITILKTEDIVSDVVSFKTISPLVVRNEQNYSLSSIDNNFRGSLVGSIYRMARFFGKQCNIKEVEYNMKSRKTPHYENAVIENHGTIKIHANREALELMYFAGIGSRRSQGFGLLDMAENRHETSNARNP